LALSPEDIEIKDQIVQNFINAAQRAQLKHIFIVVNDSNIDESTSNVLSQVKGSGIPFTCIQTSPLTDYSSTGYTFQDGIRNDLIINKINEDVNTIPNSLTNDAVCREDIAALCVQAIQSLDWKQQQRYLQVIANGPVKVPSSVLAATPTKRMDQQWCMNSYILEEKLNQID
jgi:hypothetical protein